MKNYYKLNINFDPLVSEIKFPDSAETEKIQLIDLKYASSELVAWVESLNLKLFRILLFTLPPHYNGQTIHLDGSYEHHLNYVVNWNFNVERATMNWYRELKPGVTSINNFGGEYTIWKPDDVELIDSLNIADNDPILVNSGIPHNAINLGNTTRHCVSVRLEPRSFSWSQAVEKFKPWLKQ